jgi:hypothetical protein
LELHDLDLNILEWLLIAVQTEGSGPLVVGLFYLLVDCSLVAYLETVD